MLAADSGCQSLCIYYGAEFIARSVMRWLRGEAIGPAFIAPGKPWQ